MENNRKKTTDREYYLFALKIFADFGAVIALPVVIFVLIGNYLDERYSRYPLFTVVAFIVAALLSAKMIHRKARRYGNQYQSMIDSDRPVNQEKRNIK